MTKDNSASPMMHVSAFRTQSDFVSDLTRFNGMYRMQISASPTLRIGETGPYKRLIDFKKILHAELNEIDEIIEHVGRLEHGCNDYVDGTGQTQLCSSLGALTQLADLLGDIQVFCGSEMLKFGIPQDEVLAIIMLSNFSKLFPDGAHFDDDGKLVKGPDYWKPEPQISKALQNRWALNDSAIDEASDAETSAKEG